MKNLLVFSLICCTAVVHGLLLPVQHNLLYGSCKHDEDTVAIFTQVIVMDNPGNAHTKEAKPTRWYDWFTNPFRKHEAKTDATTPKVINTTVVFPPVGIKESRLIKCIEVIDNVKFGGGFASVIDGGVNYNTTKILLKSQPGGPLDFKITIYTYKTQPVHLYPHLNAHSALGWKDEAVPHNHHPHHAPHPISAVHPLPIAHTIHALNPHPHPNQIPGQQPHKPFVPWPAFHKKK